MVNLVIVSHSSALASGVAELAGAMTLQQPIVIATAAGTGDAEHPLGTNAEEIWRAIEAAYSSDGVVVLMDLGSAIMSAEMALDFLPADKRASVRLIAAPLVEGAVAAAVQASLGGSLDEVAAEAMGALAAKLDQLGQFQPQPPLKTKVTHPLAGAQDITVSIENRLGLHARPADMFVRLAVQFASNIEIVKDGEPFDGKSILSLMTLAAEQGTKLVLRARGPDAEAALDALAELFGRGFDEMGITEPANEQSSDR
jgi:phosphocarrier protein FPr